MRRPRGDGRNLKDRIAALRDKVVISQALLDGADELRLFGNDAAHVEARVYEQIGREEVEISIEFAKELLKSFYQTASLLAKLRALKTQHDAA